MPQLWTRHIDESIIRAVAPALIQELAHICSSTTDNFSFEIVQGTSILFEGNACPLAFIEVRWFDRGTFVQDQFAQAVTKQFQSHGIQEIEIAFITYQKRNYYCNAEACE